MLNELDVCDMQPNDELTNRSINVYQSIDQANQLDQSIVSIGPSNRINQLDQSIEPSNENNQLDQIEIINQKFSIKQTSLYLNLSFNEPFLLFATTSKSVDELCRIGVLASCLENVFSVFLKVKVNHQIMA